MTQHQDAISSNQANSAILPDVLLVHDNTEEKKVSKETGKEEYPMIVWLRGDEDYIEEFSLDADAAMGMLGIKRSRLTQLSGNEIRVGRRRIGRYVKPYYRKEDIDNYLKWSRSSATSNKSKAALAEAKEILESAVGDLQANLLDDVDKIKQLVQSRIDLKLNEVSQLNSDLLKNHQTEYMDIQKKIMLAVETSSKGILSHIPSGQMIQGIFAKKIEETNEKIAAISSELKKIEADTSENKELFRTRLQSLGQALTIIIESQKNLSSEIQNLKTISTNPTISKPYRIKPRGITRIKS